MRNLKNTSGDVSPHSQIHSRKEVNLHIFKTGHQHEKYQHKIDAVITVQSECFSLINYCTLPWKFFSVSNSDDDQTNQQSEIAGIIETQLGMLHAHENLPELQSDNSGR